MVKSSAHDPVHGLHLLALHDLRVYADLNRRHARMIARSINTGRAVAFVGSGLSACANYPTWAELVRTVVAFVEGLYTMPDKSRSVSTTPHRGDYQRAQVQVLSEKLITAPVQRELDGLFAGLDLNCDGDQTRQKEILRNIRTKLTGHRIDTARLDTTAFPTYLGLCEAAFSEIGGTKFRNLVGSMFRREGGSDAGSGGRVAYDDLFRSLTLDLGIKRFITTNYDLELELAFKRILHTPTVRPCARDVALDSDDPPETVLSLNFDEGRSDDLIRFALALPGYERGIFHCHRSIEDVDRMVVTEQDYQRLYLAEDPSQHRFREALQLAFLANPIIFVGIGLQEDDLLRPLRLVASRDPRQRRDPAWFAVLPGQGPEGRDSLEGERLAARYGVKAWRFDGEVTDFPKRLRDLRRERHDWWRGWQQKPPIREAVFSRPRKGLMMRHRILAPTRIFERHHRSQLAGLRAKLRRHRLVLVVGPDGSGKGTLGEQIVSVNRTRVRAGAKPSPAFFASLRFSNDLGSILEAAARHLAASCAIRLRTTTPHERLLEAVERTPNGLVVIGSLQRVLEPSRPGLLFSLRSGRRDPDAPAWCAAEAPDCADDDSDPDGQRTVDLGDPISSEVLGLLSGLAALSLNGRLRSRVVLTSSLLPTIADRKLDAVLRAATWDAALLSREDALEPFRSLARGLHSKVEDIRRVLHGHVFAMSIVVDLIRRRRQPDDIEVLLDGLYGDLTASNQFRRPLHVAERAIRELRRFADAEDHLADAVLRTICLFSTPVDAVAIQASMGQHGSDPGDPGMLGRALRVLVERRLLFEIAGFGPDPRSRGAPRYMAHSLVRQALLHGQGAGPYGVAESQRFVLSGFAEKGVLRPREFSRIYKRLGDTVVALLGQAENARDDRKAGTDRVREMARAAFGVIRARLSIVEIPRLEHLPWLEDFHGRELSLLESYKMRLLRLLNVTRGVPGPLWSHHTSLEAGKATAAKRHPPFEHPDGVLYIDELGWLYNEIALTSFMEGELHDAFALARMVQDVSDAAEWNPVLRRGQGIRSAQAALTLGQVQIERGNLSAARRYLEDALGQARRVRDVDLWARAQGFLGLLAHLSADCDAAQKRYDVALERLRGAGNLRALSIFLRHRASLNVSIGKRDDARLDVQSAISAAHAGHFPDLYHYANVVSAKHEAAEEPVKATQMLERALLFSRRLGSRRLECEVLRTLGRVALVVGDTHEAAKLAREALGMAATLGLGLQIPATLMVLSEAVERRQDPDAARRLLHAARKLAHNQGYRLRVDKVDRILVRLGPPK